MKLKKILLFIIVVPFSLILDFVMYSFLKTCPTCGSFRTFLLSEGALSFPIVVELGNLFTKFIRSFDKQNT